MIILGPACLHGGELSRLAETSLLFSKALFTWRRVVPASRDKSFVFCVPVHMEASCPGQQGQVFCFLIPKDTKSKKEFVFASLENSPPLCSHMKASCVSQHRQVFCFLIPKNNNKKNLFQLALNRHQVNRALLTLSLDLHLQASLRTILGSFTVQNL